MAGNEVTANHRPYYYAPVTWHRISGIKVDVQESTPRDDAPKADPFAPKNVQLAQTEFAAMKYPEIWNRIDQIEFGSAFAFRTAPTVTSLSGYKIEVPEARPALHNLSDAFKTQVRILHGTRTDLRALLSSLKTASLEASPEHTNALALNTGRNNGFVSFAASGALTAALSHLPAVIFGGVAGCLISFGTGFLGSLLIGSLVGVGTGIAQKLSLDTFRRHIALMNAVIKPFLNFVENIGPAAAQVAQDKLDRLRCTHRALSVDAVLSPAKILYYSFVVQLTEFENKSDNLRRLAKSLSHRRFTPNREYYEVPKNQDRTDESHRFPMRAAEETLLLEDDPKKGNTETKSGTKSRKGNK